MGDIGVMGVSGVGEMTACVRESPSSARRRPLSDTPLAPHRPGVSVALWGGAVMVARAAGIARTPTKTGQLDRIHVMRHGTED